MTLDNLQKRIDKLLEHVHQQLPEQQAVPTLALHLFTEQEQAQLQGLLDQVEPKYDFHPSGHLDLHNVSDSELDRLELWAHLERALQQEDMAGAATYRRQLQQSEDQLLTSFLAIDENRVPDFDQAPDVRDDQGVTHRLFKTEYRAARLSVEQAQKNGTLSNTDRRTIRLWVEHRDQLQLPT